MRQINQITEAMIKARIYELNNLLEHTEVYPIVSIDDIYGQPKIEGSDYAVPVKRIKNRLKILKAKLEQ